MDDARAANLQRQANLFRAIADKCHAVIGAKDLEGHYLYVNPEYTRLFHMEAEEFIGRKDDELFPPDIARQFREADLLAQETEGGTATEEQAPVDGELRDFLSIKFPIHDDQGVLYATGLIATDISHFKRLQERLEVLAERDGLTGCYNRRKFFEIAARELDGAQRYHFPLSIQVMDLDHFKAVNDTHGHAVGDRVLQAFTKIVQSAQRKTDTLGRLGGEEFAMLLPQTELDGAVHLAQRIQDQLSEWSLPVSGGEPLAVTTSIGIAAWDGEMKDLDHLVHCADTALYRAKRAGRDGIRVHGQ